MIGCKMKVPVALLLTILLTGVLSQTRSQSADINAYKRAPSTIRSHKHNLDSVESLKQLPLKTNSESGKNSDFTTTASTNEQAKDEWSSSDFDGEAKSELKKDDDLLLLKPLFSPKDMLLQEIHTLNEEASNAKIQDKVTEAKRVRLLGISSTATPTTTASINKATKNNPVEKLLEDEVMPYEDDLSEDEEDENEDEYDDSDEEDENDEEPEDDEQVMTHCPDYCKCAGEYAAATTATCTKLVDQQSFGSGIVRLRIENAGQIRLGPHAFQSRGLQQLEYIMVTDTRIVELNQTAFDGMASLFSVNLTRNDLQDIHPNTFRNNKQLSLLAISGNPLKHTQDFKLSPFSSKLILLDAPSVTEFDFSFNGLTKLRHTAFAKMPSLTYINLNGNKLKEVDGATFRILESLVEMDLSNNLLAKFPIDLFNNSGIQTLRIAGNNFTSLNTIRALKLRDLDASNNQIKIITKDDLSGLPLLDQLILHSNDLRKIHSRALATLKQLTHLDIRNNKLTSLTEHHLTYNSRLQVLLMNDNPELGTLPVFKTSGLEYDRYNVYRFECANCGLYYLEEGTFNAMSAVTQLNLSRNRLTGLPNGLLDQLSVLRILDLSDNIIDTLQSNMFRGATSLNQIILAGNPLVTLQATPFLMTPDLTKLDVSRCALERVWSEARVPLTSLRSLSARQNLLRRITVEELKATPNLVSLDLSHNPFDCDVEFKEAVQWLTNHGVTPVEKSRYISNYGTNDNYQDSEGISKWTSLAKIICDGINDGPPPRPVPHKEKKLKIFFDMSEDSDSMLRNSIEDNEDLLKLQIDHGIKSNEEIEKAWTTQNQEYEDFAVVENTEYHPWYSNALWPVVIVIIITSLILLLTVHIAIHLAKRRGQGPVIRPPMILRQGLIDNKNCGLVYKPLQEEIATPHVPKRGSFYSSSTFHYNKIVPESV